MVKGYVTTLTEEKISRGQNRYFDMNFKKTPAEGIKIRVMSSENSNHDFFQNCFENKSPIKLKCLSPSKSGQVFYNEKVGSSVEICKKSLLFAIEDHVNTKVSDVILQQALYRFVASCSGSKLNEKSVLVAA